MNAPRKISAFTAVLALVGLVALGEGWCIFERSQAARKAQARLVQKRKELRSIASIEPAPTAANAAAIEADLARTAHALEIMRAGLQGRGPAAERLRSAVAPERRPDAFFDIAGFVEKMRELAERQGVALRPEERFGFAEYANAGPELELIPAVFRQRLVAQFLLEALLEARPRQLLSVQREHPLAPAERTAAAGGAAGRGTGSQRRDAAASPDGFELDPRVTARVPGFVDATAFRLSFVGQTSVLRSFLNRLAGFELPLVVRSVEVEPAAREAVVGAADEATAVQPLIRRTYSRFTVTVEFVELVEPKG